MRVKPIRYAASIMALAILVAPLAATAQQTGKVYRLGYLSPLPGIRTLEEAFRQHLRELGYVEGQNLIIEWRFAEGRIETFPSLAAELVRLKVDCILTLGVQATADAKQATATIDRKSTRLNSSHIQKSRMPSSA